MISIRRKYRGRNRWRFKRREGGGYSKLIVVALLVIAIFWFFGIDAKTIKNKLSNAGDIKIPVLTTNDPLVSECISNYNQCEKESVQNHGMPSTLVEARKVTNKQEAEEFYNAVKNEIDGSLGHELSWGGYPYDNEIFPLVILVVRHEAAGDNFQRIMLCDKTGKLTRPSVHTVYCEMNR